jgi:hypothetical protein
MVRVELAGATDVTPEARLRVEQPAKLSGVGTYHPASLLKAERDAYLVPLQKEATWVELTTGH